MLALQAALSGRGLDMLDEAFSLTLIAHPQAAMTGGDVFTYGMVLHPLYEFLGQDVALFRLVGLVLVVSASMWMAHESLRLLAGEGVVLHPFAVTAVVLSVAAGTTTAYAFGARTIGYRTVCLLGMMTAVAGIARLLRGASMPGSMVVGGSLGVVFMGRPTGAVALLCLVALTLVACRQWSIRVLGGVALGAALFTAAFWFITGVDPGSAAAFVIRGYRQVSLYDSYRSLPDMLGLGQFGIASTPTGLIVFGAILLLPVGIALLLVRAQRVPLWVGMTVALLVGTAVASYVGVAGLAPRGFGAQVQTVLFVLPALALTMWVLRGTWQSLGLLRAASRPVSVLVALLLALPYLAAVGTNTRFGYVMAQASVFWVLALAVVAARTGPEWLDTNQSVLATSAFSLAAVSVVVAVGVADTGLDGADAIQTERSRVEGGSLLLKHADAFALDRLRAVRQEYDLTQGTPSIDLTGVEPGYQLALGTRPLGRGAYYGFFRGAVRAATLGLGLESCEDRAAAWLLYAPGNPADISRAHVGDVLDLTTDYEVVTTVTPGQGGQEARAMTVEVLRPTPRVRAKLGCVGR